MDGLTVDQISKSYQGKEVLRRVSFDLKGGEILALLGPSGCGKSTLLNIIAGLETPDQGEIYWKGSTLRGVPPYQRRFGLMFQDYMLFPHMNVFANIAFGLRMQGWTRLDTQKRVEDLLTFVGLSEYGSHDVTTLSGGEQQRVALARSLAPRPHLLMLDEPFGSLDRSLRERLLSELRGILENLEQTALYVTHDQEEAFALADRVVVMAPGEIAQVGTPESIYSKPASVFVARFLGLSNIFTAKRSQDLIQTPVGDFTIQEPPFDALANGQAFTLLVRPDRMRIAFAENGKSSQSIHLQGVIREITFRGSIYQVRLDVNGFELRLDFPSGSQLPGVGSQLRLTYNPQETIQILD